jgi:hypothetical protein
MLPNKGMSMPSDDSGQDLNWLVSRTCEGGACVRVARMGDSILLSTINPEGPITEFTIDEWRHFVAGAKLGDFDGIIDRDFDNL